LDIIQIGISVIGKGLSYQGVYYMEAGAGTTVVHGNTRASFVSGLQSIMACPFE